MKKNRHLKLVEPSSANTNLEIIDLQSSLARRNTYSEHKAKEFQDYLIHKRAYVAEITEKYLPKLRSQPLTNVSIKELEKSRIQMKFEADRLSFFGQQLEDIDTKLLPPFATKQLVKIRRGFKQLRVTLQHSSEELEELITKKKYNDILNTKKGKVAAPKGMQLKVSLKYSEPEIWRRILVPGDCSLGELHFTIQNSMGWEDCHLHRFTIRGTQYSNQHDDCDEESYTLQDFPWRKGSRIEYVYDMGDNWVHVIEFEKMLDVPHAVLECIDGRGACPPEDIGGLDCYYDMVDVFKDPNHPEYDDAVSWLGEDFALEEKRQLSSQNN